MTKKCIVYRRASSDEVKQANSLNRQETHIDRFIQSHGYEVVEAFEEYGSAYTGGDRPQFKLALEQLSQDQDLTLVVNDLTRLSRSLIDYGDWKSFLPRIRFASMGDRKIDALMAELLLVVGANESRVLGSRISSGISAKKSREGQDFSWGFASQGHTHAASAAGVAAKRSKAIASAERIVAAVNYLESNGVSVRADQIARLNEMGVTTSRGKQISRTAIHRAFKTLNQDTV